MQEKICNPTLSFIVNFCKDCLNQYFSKLKEREKCGLQGSVPDVYAR